MRLQVRGFRPGLWLLAGLLSAAASNAGTKNERREEGVYKILVAGREIGSEKYALSIGEESATSTSVLDFRNPAGPPQRLHFETRLEMDRQFRPRTYRLKTDIDGTKGFMVGTLSPHEAMFEYGGTRAPQKSGLLVGEDYTLLDTNIFHHFIFLGRRFDFDSGEKTQRFEVVVPQESESGALKISDLGPETLVVGGKKQEAHHLKVDSGAKLIELWVDRERRLQKIAVPAIKLEVLRNP